MLQPSTLMTRLALAGFASSITAAHVNGQVTFYDLYYVANFDQLDDAAPAEPTSYATSLRLWQANSGDVGSVTVRAPDGTRRTLTQVSPACFFWGQYWIASEAELRRVLPSGRYDFAVSGGRLGIQSGPLTSPAELRWPTSIPWVRNLTELQAVTPNRDSSIHLLPWTSPSADYRTTYIAISDQMGVMVFSTTASNTASSVRIPAYTLVANTHYTLRIDFSAFVSVPQAGFSGSATSIVAWDYSTYSTISTTTNATCEADINGDGFLDLFDYLDFASCFEGDGCAGQNPDAADFNRDGFVDFFDYADFVAAFETGC
jgi:hypothetical protein